MGLAHSSSPPRHIHWSAPAAPRVHRRCSRQGWSDALFRLRAARLRAPSGTPDPRRQTCPFPILASCLRAPTWPPAHLHLRPAGARAEVRPGPVESHGARLGLGAVPGGFRSRLHRLPGAPSPEAHHVAALTPRRAAFVRRGRGNGPERRGPVSLYRGAGGLWGRRLGTTTGGSTVSWTPPPSGPSVRAGPGGPRPAPPARLGAFPARPHAPALTCVRLTTPLSCTPFPALDTEGCFVKPSVEAVRFGNPSKKWKGLHLYRQVHMRWARPGSPGAQAFPSSRAASGPFAPALPRPRPPQAPAPPRGSPAQGARSPPGWPWRSWGRIWARGSSAASGRSTGAA